MAVPIAASLSPGIAAGCLWWGMVGGGFPDWLDLRSDLRKPLRLRHRGASHGLPVALLVSGGVYGLLIALSGIEFAPFRPGSRAVTRRDRALDRLFSARRHLAPAQRRLHHQGIRPLLPFARLQCWALPRLLRCRHDGYIDRILYLASLAILALGLVAYLTPRLT